ncbi:MAG: hypothetical protein QOH97_3712 [Actinoplanes sp.]|nr:hypothetical protein [Actinoplanes sp.]
MSLILGDGWRTVIRGILDVMAQPSENRPTGSTDGPVLAAFDGSAAGATLEPAPDLPPPGSSGSSDLLPPASPDLLPPAGTEKRVRVRVPWTRVSAAWLGIWTGAVALILLIIFVAQNTANVRIDFLWMSGSVSLAVALLVAGVGGALIAMAVAAARIIQLRRLVHRGR